MATATDAVWVDVLPNMRGFGPAMAKGVGPAGAAAGTTAGVSFGKAALAATAVVATGAALATTALFGIGSTFQSVENTIRVGTGATGDALDDLTESAKNVGRTVPAEFDDVANAVADLNTRLGLTGEPLEEMAGQFLELSRITGTDLQGNIASMTRVFGDWDVAADQQSDTLDRLFRVSQATGIGVDTLADKVVQFGSPLRAMGFSLDESAALFGKFEKEGVNAELVIGSLRQGLGRMARAGEDAPATFRRVVDEISGMESRTEATAAAMELFGARAGPDMAAAIQEGRFDLEELMGIIDSGSDTIMGAAGDTQSFSEQWLMFKNRVMVGLAPLAKRVFDAITTGMTWIADHGVPAIRTFGEWVQRNAVWLAPLAGAIGAVVAAVAAWTLITKAFNVVLAIKNALLAANPIGLVILAIIGLAAALVVAYQRSETFRNIVQKVWEVIRNAIGAVVSWFTDTAWPAIRKVFDAIAAAAKWLWEKAIKPAWEGIRLAVAVAVELIKLYWNKVLKPVWKAIGEGIQQIWRNVLQPVFGFIGDTWKKLLEGISQVWRNVLKPAWDAVSAAAKWMWERALQPVFRAVGEVWAKLLEGMGQVWRNVLRPVFDAVASAVGVMRDAVDRAVSAIGRAWDGLKRAFAAPVNWVIDNVINKFLGWVNRIADEIGVSFRIKLVPNVSWGSTAASGSGGGALARNRGGIIPGMGPDRDSVLTALTPGEFVWSRTAVDNVGASQVAQMHEAARRGERMEMGDSPFGWLKSVATAALNWARKFIVNTVRPGFDAAMNLMDATVGKWGIPGQMAAGSSRKLGDSLLDWMAGIEDEADTRTPDLGSGIGWQAMWDAVRGAFPWARFTSGYRPGAITATGNPSYHGKGRAVDVAGRTPMNHPDMLQIAQWIRDNYQAKTLELIYSRGPSLINGKPWTPTGVTKRNHFDHVHWAMDNGGWLMPGVSQIANWTGKPEAVLTDQQWRTLRDAAVRNQQGSGDSFEFHGVREDVIVAKLARQARLRQVTR